MTSLNIVLRLETSFKTPEISSTDGRFCVSVLVLDGTLTAVDAGKLTLIPTLLRAGKVALLFVVAEVDADETFADERWCWAWGWLCLQAELNPMLIQSCLISYQDS